MSCQNSKSWRTTHDRTAKSGNPMKRLQSRKRFTIPKLKRNFSKDGVKKKITSVMMKTAL